MKYFLSLFVLITCVMFSPGADASGKISIQNNFFDQGKKYRPMIGLGIYEPIFGGALAINSWTGYGNQPFDLSSDVDWFTTKNQLDFYFGKLTVSPGFQYSFVSPYKEDRSWLYMKLDYKLW